MTTASHLQPRDKVWWVARKGRLTQGSGAFRSCPVCVACHAPLRSSSVQTGRQTPHMAVQRSARVCGARRQIRSVRDWGPVGWFIAAVYLDIESGALDLA